MGFVARMRLRNVLKFAFDACQALENMSIVLHPVQRFQYLSLISFYLTFERIELLIDRIESLIDGIEPLIDLDLKQFEAFFDGGKPSVERTDFWGDEVLDQLTSFLDEPHPRSSLPRIALQVLFAPVF
jgi:hypothetical protein